MPLKRAISFSIAMISIGIPLLLAFTNCSQGGFDVSSKNTNAFSVTPSAFLLGRIYDPSFGEYSALYLNEKQISSGPSQQKLKTGQSAQDSGCELVGDFNLKTHYKAGVGPSVGGTDSVAYENAHLAQQYASGVSHIPLYSNKSISLNSYIGDRYETDLPGGADLAKQTVSLLCGDKVKKVSFVQPETNMTASTDLSRHLVEGAPYHQIIHGIPYRNNLFTVIVPPFWTPKLNKYPVLVNGFYSLNHNVFHTLGEGQTFFRLQRRLVDEGQRGFIGIMWNGGGAHGSRTMSDLAYRDFNDFVGLISQDLGFDNNKAVSFGISRGGITALNLAAHPAVKNLRFAYVNAASPAIDAGYIADLITPTIPALLYANDWSSGYLGSWRNSFQTPSGKPGVSQHLLNIVGSDDIGTIGSRYSIISADRLNKLKTNQTVVYMELSSHDIIVPFADQLRGLNKMIEQQVKVEGRINYLLGHQEDDPVRFERIYRVLLALGKNQAVPTGANGAIDRRVLVENTNREKIFSRMALSYGGAPLTIEVPRLVVPDSTFQVIVTGTPGRRYIMTAQDSGSVVPKTLDFTVDSSGINIINLQFNDIAGSEISIDDIYEIDSQGAAQFKLQTRSSVAGSNQKLKISKLQSSFASVPHFHGLVVNSYLGDNCKKCLLTGEFNSYGLLEVDRAPASEVEKINLQSYLNARCGKGESYDNGVCKGIKPEPTPLPTPTLTPIPSPAVDLKGSRCAAGSATVNSADGKSSCSFSWTEAGIGAASSATVLSGNLTVSGTCEKVNNTLTWKWNYSCASANQVACPGGQYIAKSPSGRTTCTYPFSPKLPGQSQTVAATTGSGQVIGLCLRDGRWQYTATCNDSAVVSCPGGEQLVGKKCWFNWSGAASGETRTVADQNGTGSTFKGTCGADGVWKNIVLPVNNCD